MQIYAPFSTGQRRRNSQGIQSNSRSQSIHGLMQAGPRSLQTQSMVIHCNVSGSLRGSILLQWDLTVTNVGLEFVHM